MAAIVVANRRKAENAAINEAIINRMVKERDDALVAVAEEATERGDAPSPSPLSPNGRSVSSLNRSITAARFKSASGFDVAYAPAALRPGASKLAEIGTFTLERVRRARAANELEDQIAFAQKDVANEVQLQIDAMMGRMPFQKRFHEAYIHPRSQSLIALLITANFVTNVLEKEIDPHGIRYPQTWKVMENIFNALFLVELLVNLFAHWFLAFFMSGWNLFDLLVVTIGCVSWFVDLANTPLKLLRTFRAFRVFRLFRRVESLNKLITMIANAIPGVSHAFTVMLICVSIYAMIAVEFFADFGGVELLALEANLSVSDFLLTPAAESLDSERCAYRNVDKVMVSGETWRGLCFGHEYFGTFSRAWFTLFQCLTADGWSDVARPALFGWEGYGPGFSGVLASFFFVSFILVNSFVLFNVFVAVLLEKMLQPDSKPNWEDLLGRIEGTISSVRESAKEGSSGKGECQGRGVSSSTITGHRLEAQVAALTAALVRIERKLDGGGASDVQVTSIG